MTLEQITHDLASIDRVVYRTDLRRHGLHAWMLSRSSKAGEALLISFKVNEPFPTDEEWAAKLADIKAKHAPSIVMAEGSRSEQWRRVSAMAGFDEEGGILPAPLGAKIDQSPNPHWQNAEYKPYEPTTPLSEVLPRPLR